MSTPTYANIIVELASQIDVLTQTFIFNGYNALASYLAKPLAGLCVLAITLMGYGISRGLIKTSSQEFSKLVFRIGIIYMLAMNWGIFSEYFVEIFISGASKIGAVLMKANPFGAGSSGVNNGLQSAFNKVIRVASWTQAKASFNNPGPLFTALAMYISGIAVIGFALFEIIIAKLMLALCLSSAPLFFCFTLFEQTKSFFDKWLGSLVGFSLVLVMVSSVVGLCMHLIHWTIGSHYANHAINVSATDWIPIFIVACLCVMAIFEVTVIAKSIGGACSTSNGSAMVGGFLEGAAGASTHGKTFSQKTLSLAKGAVPGAIATQFAQMKGPSSQVEQGMSGIRNHMRGQS